MTMASKDYLTWGIMQKKSIRENITPHKIAVVLLIREYCLIKGSGKSAQSEHMSEFEERTSSPSIEPRHRRDFCMLMLKLIQCPDMELHELQELLTSEKYKILPACIVQFNTKLEEVYQEGVAGLLDLIQSLSQLMEPSHITHIIKKTSTLGLYLRCIIVFFDKLSFSQVVKVYQAFKFYYDNGKARKGSCIKRESHPAGKDVEMSLISEEGSSIDKEPLDTSFNKVGYRDIDCGRWSRRQAELFIAQQASLMQINESSALPAPQLQEHIRDLLRANPEFAEAHYLSYLNCLRVKEFCGALHSLYHCFDRSTLTTDSKSSSQEEKSKGFRYAALNLAVLHAQFGHKKEAQAALKEAITMAHEANDNVCLQHALAWMYKLCDDNKEILMERSISKSSELNLSYLISLGIQSFAQYAGVTGGKPSLVFDVLTKSDVLNCQHSMIELMANSYSQKAALWTLYGKTDMASLCSQLLLHLNTTDFTRGSLYFNGESTCKAICNVANILMEHGEYQLAAVVLDHASARFPHEPQCHVWMLCEQLLRFVRAMHHAEWQEAEAAVASLAAIDQWEGLYRKAELYIGQGNYTQASTLLHNLLDHCKQDKESLPSLRVRALILAGELQCSTQSSYSTAINFFTTALAQADLHHLDYLRAMVGFHMANLQLQMGLPSQALKLIDEALLTVLAHGGNYDQGRALLLNAKCVVAASVGQAAEKRRPVLFTAIEMLNKVKANFSKVEAHHRVKDVLYLQALLYNELECVPERKKCALEFRKLDEQHPTKLANTLLTFL